MTKISSKLSLTSPTVKGIVAVIATLLLGIFLGKVTTVTVTPEPETGDVTIESGFTMELADEQVPTVIETADGEVEVIEAPTVEEVDGGNLNDTECDLATEDCGRGAYYYVDVTSPNTIKDSILGNCIDVDGWYGSQCVDAAAAVSENMTGRRMTTCGTGAAKGMMDCWEQNAGSDYEVIWDKTQLQPGDIVVLDGGRWGHVGIAMGGYNEGYLALLGTNQGGAACAGGGSSANIININLKNFLGAYRWKNYVKTEPETEATTTLPVTGCKTWDVIKGDTMSKIMLECENTVRYGEAMDAYAKTWFSLFVMPGQSVYDGWKSESGVGLYAGDEIEHRTE